MTKNYVFEDLIGQRRGKPVESNEYPASRGFRPTRPKRAEGTYEHMFMEDLAQLLPYNRRDEMSYTAHLDTEQGWVLDVLLNALPVYHRPASTLEDGLREFARRCAYDLAQGPVVLELEFFSRADGSPSPYFRIHRFDHGAIGRRHRKPIQFVPRHLSSHSTKGRPYLELDAATLVEIDVVPERRVNLRRALAALEAADAQTIFPIEMLTEGGKALNGFDLDFHQTETASVVLLETRAIGWGGRRLFLTEALDPYRVWRHLQFLKLQLSLREAVLAGVQEALDRAGARSGFSATLVVDGLLDLVQIEDAELALRAGTRSIASLFAI